MRRSAPHRGRPAPRLSDQDPPGLRLVEVVRELLAILNSHRTLEEILEYVVEQAAALLPSDAGAIYLLETDQGEAWLKIGAARGLPPDRLALRLRIGAPVSGLAVLTRRPVAFVDLVRVLQAGVAPGPEPLLEDRGSHLIVRRIGRRRLESDSLERLGRLAATHPAMLSVPLMLPEGACGALSLLYHAPRDFSDAEVQLASAFADQAALAIENARLRDGAQRRAVELETLYRADERMHATLRLPDVLQALVDIAAEMLAADKTSVLLWDAERQRLTVQAAHGFRLETIPRMAYPRGEGISTRVAMSGDPIAVEDVQRDARISDRIRDINATESIRSVISVPIKVGDEVVGVFNANWTQPRSCTPDEQRLLLALGQRAATAITNARLYAQADQRLRELEALYRADEVLLRELHLDDVLQALVEVVTDLLNADKASVLVWDDRHERLVARAAQGYDPETIARLYFVPGEGIAGRVAQTGQTLLVEDVIGDPRSSERITQLTAPEGVQSLICVPITIQGQVYGVFNVGYRHRRTFNKEDARPFEAVAQRAALAIENARLYEQAQQGAIAEERQRLARELHDAVTQTLFSASLIAEVTPRLWERDPSEGRRRLEELRRLTRGALAEMRTLLLELRPAAFQEARLPDLLRHLAESTSSRAGAAVTVSARGERTLPPEVQLAIYRIAQEALNNVVKHAHADRAEVILNTDQHGLELVVLDNGQGFDPTSTPSGHFGLQIMHERSQAIGATLEVSSRTAGGTCVAVRWRDPTHATAAVSP